jgi:surface antigen-like variable number repeat protein
MASPTLRSDRALSRAAWALVGVMLILAGPLHAQNPADSAAADTGSTVIRAVELERRDIFDPDEHGWIARLGNALHVQTRPGTIRRELLFQPGEVYDSAKVAESERNLRALGVFRRVRIDTVRTDSGLVARVLTKDGWSTQIDYRFRSAGGQVEFTIGLIENNLLGTASSAAARYRKTTDRSTVALGFRRPRLIAGRLGLSAQYEDRSDGRLNALLLEQPFFALTSPFAYSVSLEDHDERVLRFFDGTRVARDTLSRRYSIVRAAAAWALSASSRGFVRAGVQGQVRRDDFVPEGSPGSFPKTVTGAVGPFISWNRASFLVARGFAGFAREEDVDLGATVRLGILAAPKAFGYDRNGIAPLFTARFGTYVPHGFAYLEALAGGLYDSAGLDSGSVQLAATAVFQPTRHQVGILHAEGGWTKNPLPGSEFDLGLGQGPRAFRSHAFTGDRSFFTTAEYRVTLVDDFLGMVGLGLAGFVDHGGAWYAGSPRRTGWDAGLGIRLGASRSTDTEALRFDLARRFANDAQGAGWVVTVGKGFVFSPLGKRQL